MVGAAIFVVAAGAISFSLSREKSRGFILEEVIRLSLSQCFSAPTEGIASDDEITLKVSLSKHGTLTHMPELITPDILTKGEGALVREAGVALFLCTPITSANRSKAIYGEFELAVNGSGIRVYNVKANVADLPDIPGLDAFENFGTANLPSITPGEGAAPVASVTEVEDESPPVEVIEEEPDAIPVAKATQEDEEALALLRADRRKIQRRFVLAGYNTRGVDGVFGKGSRAAISAWQGDNEIPVSSYLNEEQIALLDAQTQEAYVAWNRLPKRYFDRNGCLREPNGDIVPGRSFSCDLSGLGQGLGIVK